MGKPEAHVEDYLRKRVRDMGGFHRKVVYQGRIGSPDDWCFFPEGQLFIAECKSEVGRLTKAQEAEIELLRENGFSVFVLGSRREVDLMMELVR